MGEIRTTTIDATGIDGKLPSDVELTELSFKPLDCGCIFDGGQCSEGHPCWILNGYACNDYNSIED